MVFIQSISLLKKRQWQQSQSFLGYWSGLAMHPSDFWSVIQPELRRSFQCTLWRMQTQCFFAHLPWSRFWGLGRAANNRSACCSDTRWWSSWARRNRRRSRPCGRTAVFRWCTSRCCRRTPCRCTSFLFHANEQKTRKKEWDLKDLLDFTAWGPWMLNIARCQDF